MRRPELFRALAILALIGAFMETLAAINRESERQVPLDTPMSSIPDDLSEELRRCRAIGPQNGEDPRCEEVWEKNRRHFFGTRARQVPPGSTMLNPSAADPTTTNPASGGAR
jgi:conjugative transfer region protein TrbK